jgi:hypothetical protein
MAKGMNWWRSGRQTSMGRRGSVSLSDERERLGHDRAARWIDARLSGRARPRPPSIGNKRHSPQRPATAPSSAVPPWD